MTVIDANGLILGRLASIVAQRLLSGEEIDVINAERAVVSGSPETTLSKYQTLRNKGSKEKGPYFPKRSGHDSTTYGSGDVAVQEIGRQGSIRTASSLRWNASRAFQCQC